MKLIIDIPEEVYKRMTNGDLPIYMAYKYVKNGAPLPEGHGRLIDADDAISKICGGSCGCHFEECGYDKPCFSVTRIESAQTIIEADKEEEK